MFLIIKSKGAMNVNFGWNFENVRFCIFQTHGHTWVHLVYATHETLQHIAFEITTTNFDEIEDKHQKLFSNNY